MNESQPWKGRKNGKCLKETQRRVAKHASIDFNLNFTRSTVHPSSEPSAFRAVRKSRDLESFFLGHLLGADCEWKKFPIEISKLRSLPTTMTGPEPLSIASEKKFSRFRSRERVGERKTENKQRNKINLQVIQTKKERKIRDYLLISQSEVFLLFESFSSE